MKKGYIALISTIIVSAIVLSIGLSLIFVNLNASLSGLIVRQSDQARALAKTCSELALYELSQNYNYLESNTYTFYFGQCQYSVLSSGANGRLINSSGVINDIYRKEQVFLNQENSRLNIIYWQDVADF